jgi:hypothetical protein
MFRTVLDEILYDEDYYTLKAPRYIIHSFTPYDDEDDNEEKYKPFYGHDCFLDCDDVSPNPIDRYNEEHVEVSDEDYDTYIAPLSPRSLAFFSRGCKNDMEIVKYYFKKIRAEKFYQQICDFNLQLFNEFYL